MENTTSETNVFNLEVFQNLSYMYENNTNITLQIQYVKYDSISVLASVLVLITTMCVGLVTNALAVYKASTQDFWRNLTYIQFCMAGIVTCSILIPMQIIRIALVFAESPFIDLCYYHHLIHLLVKACTYVSIIMAVYQRLAKWQTCDCEKTPVTVPQVLSTFSWIMLLPLATYVVYTEETGDYPISIFSADCLSIRENTVHITEEIGNYFFLTVFITSFGLHLVYVHRIWMKNHNRLTRVHNHPNVQTNALEMHDMSRGATVLTPNEKKTSKSKADGKDLQASATSLQAHAKGHLCDVSSKSSPISNKSCTSLYQKKVPRPPTRSEMPLSEFEMHLFNSKKTDNTKIDLTSPSLKTTSLFENIYNKDRELFTEQATQFGDKKRQTVTQLQNLLRTSTSSNHESTTTSGRTVSTFKDSSITDTSTNEEKLVNEEKNNKDNCRTVSCSDVSLTTSNVHSSNISEIAGATSDKTLSRKPKLSECKSGSKGSYLSQCSSEMDENVLKLHPTPHRKISRSESKGSTRSQQSTETDETTKLNPLRHTRVNPGNVRLHSQEDLKAKLETLTMPKKSSKKKKKKGKKILEKQLSKDSIGAFSMTSTVSVDSVCVNENCHGDTISVSSSYKYNSRSIDSFLDEGLTNILEQPEQEEILIKICTEHDNSPARISVSQLEQGDGTLNYLEMPEMRFRSNTGDIKLSSMLQVNEDDFRHRAQSDLTEDKQKRLLETKKFQSIRNRKICKTGSDELSYYSDSSAGENAENNDGNVNIALPVENNAGGSMESIDLKPIDTEKSTTTSGSEVRKISLSKGILKNPKFTNGTTQTDTDDLKNKEQTQITNETYPVIHIIRPSKPDSGNYNISKKLSTPVRSQNINTTARVSTVQRPNFLRVDSIPGNHRPNATCNCSNRHVNLVQALLTCLVELMTFLAFYLPTIVVTYLLDSLNYDTKMEVLIAARSIEYLYYMFVPKIYKFNEKQS